MDNYRAMVVLEPLKVTIQNFPYKEPTKVTMPNFPTKPELRGHDVIFDKVIYIERNDFMETGDKGYKRLTKTQSVGLRHAGFVLECIDVIKNSSGYLVEILCKCAEVDIANKPKAFIHWVSKPIHVEIKLYESLFKHKNPEDPNEVPDGFLSDCNMDSLKIIKSYADESLTIAKVYDRFQFERLGFFSIDPDSRPEKVRN